jgi:poly-gamma-glutamate capsule biosynthesis protein CapA/YwtB (metallophosphatase superfamily)
VKSYSALSALTLTAVLLAMVLLSSGESTVTLALAGDVMLGRSVSQAHAEGGWKEILATLAPYVASADLGFANLESPLTDAPLIGDGYDLRAPEAAVRALRGSGFDLVSLANNHALDAGAGGLSDTQQSLLAAGIDFVGPNADVILTRIKRMTLAWIALDDIRRPIEVEQARARVADARGRADVLIVSIHWGAEFEAKPNARQRMLAAELAAAGADLIVGHHAHVLQPVEWIWGDGRGRSTLVAFGMGNAIFDQGTPAEARHGATLLVDVGAAGVRGVQAVPHQIQPGSWQAAPAGPSLSSAVASSLNMACAWVRGCR